MGEWSFKGTVDLQPTLDRIEAGEKLPYSHDGVTFENREGRLPKKPRGYYSEYVHLTPHQSGPGAWQLDRFGAKWEKSTSTHDHYRTFQRILIK